MKKQCINCGSEWIECIKTGFYFNYKSRGRVGDLFECKMCGARHIFGIPSGIATINVDPTIKSADEVPETGEYPWPSLINVKFQGGRK